MKIPEKIAEFITNADSKALATANSGEVSVIPVSTIKVTENKVLLVNYFMGTL